MDRFAHYGWPFFDARHAELAREVEAWARDNLQHAHGDDADAICRRLRAEMPSRRSHSPSRTRAPTCRR